MQVNLGKKVSYETLERALVAAAGDIGWTAETADTIERKYFMPISAPIDEYAGTKVLLRGKFRKLFIKKLRPAMEAFISSKARWIKDFARPTL